MNELKDEINELTDKLRQTTNEQKNLEEERSIHTLIFNRIYSFFFAEIIFLNNWK